uniref:Uncharacterized protein n=1 Tax=Glossina pallidipes TaxID=7398 RepID=A0A1B0AG46_GLOPL
MLFSIHACMSARIMQCINPNSRSNNVEFFSYTLNDNNEKDDNDKNDDLIDDVVQTNCKRLFATVGDDNYVDDDDNDDDDDDDDIDYGRILFLKFSQSTGYIPKFILRSFLLL